MSLFDADAEDGSVVIADRPDAKTVRLLEGFNYRKEAVRGWSAEKAATVLATCKREQAIALRHAAAVAREQDETAPPRGQTSLVERQVAAAFIEQSQGCGIDEIYHSVMYSVHALRDDEVKRLADFLIRKLRGQG